MSVRSLKHRLEYGAFRVLSGVLLAVPEAWALRLGAILGWVAGVVLRIRRPEVDAHLAWAFPTKPASWRRRTARASYVHLGREAVAMFRMAGLDAEAVVARTTVAGLEGFRSALEEGRGVVLVTGHLGNWEIGGAALTARGIPVDAVAKGMANRRFDDDLVATRERLGMRVVGMQEAPRRILRALRDGRVAALVADQNFHRGGIFVPFFGRLAATAKGPALFALRSGAPLFLGVALREPGWPQRYRIELRRIDVTPTGELDRDVHALTEAHTDALEREVRAHPEQYFWQHKRWKTRPPEEPAPEGSV
jgi:KDO2-lipid IV(A) lauroyltransferase